MMSPILAFSIALICAFVCQHLATKKGKQSKHWFILGFVFGIFPIIILLLIKPEPTAASPLIFDDRVAFYFELGLLNKNDELTLEQTTAAIHQSFTEEWGEDFESSVQLDEHQIVAYGSRNVWWGN